MIIKLIVRLLKKLWGIYAFIIFISTLLISFCSYVLVFLLASKKKSPFIAHQYVSRYWSRVLFFFFGIRLIVKNKERLDKNQTYVFIANHRSQLDIPCYAIATDHTIRFLSKVELTKIPLLGYVIRHLYITVDRKDKEARAKSMEKMIKSLSDGISVFICPEGTRNKGNEPLLQFHDGAFKLAIQSQNPLALLVLNGVDKLNSPKHPLELSPGRVTGQWCEPIPTKGMTEEDLPALKEAAIKQMLVYLH